MTTEAYDPFEDIRFEAENPKVNCPDCGGTGTRRIPLLDDWDDVEGWTEVKCSYCGGEGKFYADNAAELQAEGSWFDTPSYY